MVTFSSFIQTGQEAVIMGHDLPAVVEGVRRVCALSSSLLGNITATNDATANVKSAQELLKQRTKAEGKVGRLTGVLRSCHDRDVEVVSFSFTKGVAGAVVGGTSGADEFESTACPSDPNSPGTIVGSLQAFVTHFI